MTKRLFVPRVSPIPMTLFPFQFSVTDTMEFQSHSHMFHHILQQTLIQKRCLVAIRDSVTAHWRCHDVLNATAVTYWLLRPGRELSIAINLSVCVFVYLHVCLSVREHISGTAGPILTKFVVQIPCGRGSVLLWRRCDTLCTFCLLITSHLAVMGRMAMRG